MSGVSFQSGSRTYCRSEHRYAARLLAVFPFIILLTRSVNVIVQLVQDLKAFRVTSHVSIIVRRNDWLYMHVLGSTS